MDDISLSSSLEDYLEAIYQIGRDKQFAQANEIAEYLGVGKSSVSWALNQLARRELINYAPYAPITLTERGRSLAGRVARRHDEIKQFLTDVLAVDEKTAEENACRMEHVLDKDILKRMKQFKDFLEQCPRAGREWMMGFGHFCRQGHTRENCPQCISECLEHARQNTADTNRENQTDQSLPKTSKDRDRHIVERLNQIMQESGHSLTPPELAVAEAFMATEQHQNLAGIHKQAQALDPEVTHADVQQALEVLCEHKIARAFTFDDQVVYEHLHPESHHDHLFCVKCSAIVEFFDPRIEALQTENARRADFRMLQHSLNIFGVCHDCIKLETHTRNLDECLTGETVEVVRIAADKQTRERITDMGLTPKRTLNILSDNCYGDNMIVMVGQTRLMLDKPTARKVRIVPVDTDQAGTAPGRRRYRHRHAADRTAAPDPDK